MILSDYSMYAGTMDANLSCCLTNRIWRVCGLSSWLRTSSSTVATLSAVRAVRGRPLPGTLSAVPYLVLSILQASSQVLCVSNFSVEILAELS